MGHRSYLYLKSSDRELYLFEANNSLPFFWLSLLDRQTLKNKISDWEKITLQEEDPAGDESGQGPALQSNNLSISEKTFTANAARSKPFLQKHFPGTVPLYEEFIKFLKSKFAGGDYLQIDILSFSAFYNSLTEYCIAIDKELQSIETDNPEKITFLFAGDLIGNGTGFAYNENKEFSTLPAYQEAIKSRTTPTIKYEPKFRKKSLLIFLVLLLLCPLFSFLTFKMYKEDGLTFSIILTGIVNAGFYLFCIWSIFAEIKAYKKEKG